MGLALGLMLATRGASTEPPRPNLPGEHGRSTPVDGAAFARGDQPAASTGGGGGRHHAGGTGRNGGNPPHDKTDDAKAETGWRPSIPLTITQSEGQVSITDKEGRTRILKTNGSKVRDEAARGGPAQIKTSWDSDGSLVVEIKPDKGPSRTETYVVADDRKHLYWTITGGTRIDAKIVRAYDPAPVEEPAPAPSKPPQ